MYELCEGLDVIKQAVCYNTLLVQRTC